MEQVSEGEKEGDVLGTSSQWVVMNSHYCFLQTASDVKGGDGVDQRVLSIKGLSPNLPPVSPARTTEASSSPHHFTLLPPCHVTSTWRHLHVSRVPVIQFDDISFIIIFVWINLA